MMTPTIKATCAVGLMAAIACGAAAANADEYPTKTITMIVPYGAGGITDTMGRITANAMQQSLGEKIVVVNKTGAAGTIGMTEISRARTDGYTIATIPAAPLVIQPHLRQLSYDLDSYEYVCQTFASPIVLAVNDDSPFTDFAQVVEEMKRNPGGLTYSTAGPGSVPHVYMARLLKEIGAEMRHVPMAGDAGATTAALGGHVDFALVAGTSVVGKDIRTVAVFADERSEQLPDAPTAKEVGYDFAFLIWGGVIAPKGVPQDAVATLSEACKEAVDTPDFAEQLAKLASMPAYKDSEAFRAFAAEEFEVNAEVVKNLDLVGN